MKLFIEINSQKSDQAPYCHSRMGQVLLMTVIVIGAAMLSATTIAGLLMVYQVHGSSDIASSQRAIAAADAGLECQMYDNFLQNDSLGNPDPTFTYINCPNDVSFSNADIADITCTDSTDTSQDCTQTSTVANIYSRGNSNGASRILQISF